MGRATDVVEGRNVYPWRLEWTDTDGQRTGVTAKAHVVEDLVPALLAEGVPAADISLERRTP